MYKSIQQFQHISNLLPYLAVTNIVQSNTSCCMCTCIVNLKAQVRLICSWCMKICLTRAARISTERLISVQPDELLRAEEKKPRSSIVYRSKERETINLYTKEREGKLHVDWQSRSPKPSTSAEPSSSAWGQTRPMEAASHRSHARVHQHRRLWKPLGQIPSQHEQTEIDMETNMAENMGH